MQPILKEKKRKQISNDPMGFGTIHPKYADAVIALVKKRYIVELEKSFPREYADQFCQLQTFERLGLNRWSQINEFIAGYKAGTGA